MAVEKVLTKEQKELKSTKEQLVNIEKRLEVAEKRVTSLVEFCKATLETNADLLAQVDGAIKSNRKLHSMGAQNLGQLIQVLDQEKRSQ